MLPFRPTNDRLIPTPLQVREGALKRRSRLVGTQLDDLAATAQVNADLLRALRLVACRRYLTIRAERHLRGMLQRHGYETA